LESGDLFLFKLHYPENAIVGGGMFLWSSPFPFPIAWEAFGEKNGAASIQEMRARVERYTRVPIEAATHEVECIVVQPFFLAEEDWILPPADWAPNIVRGKTYDLTEFGGRRLLEEVEARLRLSEARAREVEGPIYGTPGLARRRLGQGAFRLLITDVYQRRCAVTGERALPVLEAGHIRPVSEGGMHRVDNGVLLRSDVHTLFDRG
jgi:putative restriction endonuclease